MDSNAIQLHLPCRVQQVKVRLCRRLASVNIRYTKRVYASHSERKHSNEIYVSFSVQRAFRNDFALEIIDFTLFIENFE